MDANDSSFTKDNVSLIQYLLSFQNADGGFGWQVEGIKVILFQPPKVFKALVAYQLLCKWKRFYIPSSIKRKN